ncbi:hypothetical protein FDP41_005068 [Naegleria fowleri]|uniref:HMG box domain-containing protein n=1 Tax=Naegleria fowleri TaxID=5763 RepID=A0A6A5BN69_NAEFO|nr:uncharacterized protein FDP41_005068 [Naegleria fowleri]KAF0975741.1 hypothetical protein FDP41_005068 [Naegleria fowleri]
MAEQEHTNAPNTAVNFFRDDKREEAKQNLEGGNMVELLAGLWAQIPEDEKSSFIERRVKKDRPEGGDRDNTQNMEEREK